MDISECFHSGCTANIDNPNNFRKHLLSPHGLPLAPLGLVFQGLQVYPELKKDKLVNYRSLQQQLF